MTKGGRQQRGTRKTAGTKEGDEKAVATKTRRVAPKKEANNKMEKEQGKKKAKDGKEAKRQFDVCLPPFEWFDHGENRGEGFEAVTNMLKDKKQILVLCGAGLSVSCGIPDFRSKTGLYATLNLQELVCEEKFVNIY
jgi:hypothetical protein